MRVGILGGTFDPIHNGHLALAEAARDCVPLDGVLLVPARSSPHKEAVARASPEQRLEMCRLAGADLEWLDVWDSEVGRRGPSYTLDTLLDFRRQRPGDEPFLVLGWDAARELPSWHEPESVLSLASLLVVPRPGLPFPMAEDLLAAGLDPIGTWVCPQSTPAIDATGIR